MLRGGFIGVDVFFVISGYLISGIIFRALEKGTFTFRDFYVRRINRILPALVVVLVACLLIGWLILMPGEYRALGKHSFGGSTFVSNVILWREAGYFDSPNKPLLHLWSLAVEEQFYILWPPLALIAWRRKWNLMLTIGIVLTSSFLVSIWTLSRSLTVEAFYFPGTRFWEIMAGAMLTANEFRRTSSTPRIVRAKAIVESAAVAALGLFAVTLIVVNHETPWPGILATIPVAGTLLLIGTGPQTWVSRKILANPALVQIGLISYPWYLWHWPLIVFAKLVNGGPLPWPAMTGVVLVSLIFAWITYRLVEIPIRFGSHKRRSAALLLPTLATVGCAGLLVKADGIKPRLYAAASALDEAQNDREGAGQGEGIDGEGRPIGATIPGSPDSSVIFIGDSHVQHYWPRVARLSRTTAGFPTVLFLRYGSCVPMPEVERRGTTTPSTQRPLECARFHRLSIELAKESKVRAIALAASWESYLTNQVTYVAGDQRPLATEGPQTDKAFALLAAELRELTESGKRVYIVLNNPVDRAFDPVSMLPSRVPGLKSDPPMALVPRSRIEARSRAVNVRLREAAKLSGAIVIDPLDVMCDRTSCPTMSPDGAPIYRDDNHMRASFVREKATFIDRVFGAGQH